MFCIMMMSATNVIVIAVLPFSFSDMLCTFVWSIIHVDVYRRSSSLHFRPQIVTHSVLTSRILFNLPVNKVPVFPHTIDTLYGNDILSTRV
ncbi:uncharacterized protein BJ212DRAFT_584385 [Suillus subaureus]|uniref:Uncharacterized protein n=1 Tax=Suillus subaureus TaxID=48587 RepID=A0A9P7E447_9AGAM|nr:uncharacterized protein BJ212DRAFT_584385 [Suillus subaureus]KAG1810603.1 hypothetical protein BJ212DRAFT_584385 [Suillus subaureus]